MHRTAALITSLFVSLLQGCATGPGFDASRYATAPKPSQAAEEASTYKGTSVMWGGLIINTTNLEEGTLIEVLGYPLDSAQRPRPDQSPQGRFLVYENRYLEGVDYAQGRLLTTTGTFTETETGRIGESTYVYPVIEAEELFLWSEAGGGGGGRTRFNIGVGVIFSR